MRTRSPERAEARRSRGRARHAPLLALSCGLALASAGCGTLATHQGTTPVEPGKWQVAASAGALLLADTEQKTTAPGAEVQLAVRRGLATDLDAGLRLSPFGLDALMKWRIVGGNWPVAVAPSFGVARTPNTALTTDALYTWAHLPILFGRRLSEHVRIHFGPHLIHGYYLPRAGGSAHGLSLGGFVNLEWSLGHRARLVPEIALFRTLLGEVPLSGWAGYVGPGVLVDL